MSKIIVITGASSGIGKALAELYAKDGIVVNLSRTNAADADNFIECDITDEDDVAAAFSVIWQKFGKIDILINNAGVGISGATELLSSDRVRQVMDVNFMGTFYCCKYGLRLMERGAKVVNISSVTAFFATPFRTVYCAAKAAVSMFSNGIRMELAPSGIQVTAICPAETKTNFTKNRIKEFVTSERYGDRVENAAKGVDDKESKRMPVEDVAAKIYRIVGKKRLKPSYIIGGKFKVLRFIQRLVSENFLIKMTDKMFGGHKK